jgi:hypothetical protein
MEVRLPRCVEDVQRPWRWPISGTTGLPCLTTWRTFMTDEEIKKLALDIRSNLVFGSWNIRKEEFERMVGSVFMPLLFMDEESRKQMKDEEIFHIYEYMSQAGPRSINGYPMFMSFRSINKTDAEKLFKVIAALEDAEKAALEAL